MSTCISGALLVRSMPSPAMPDMHWRRSPFGFGLRFQFWEGTVVACGMEKHFLQVLRLKTVGKLNCFAQLWMLKSVADLD